MPTTWVLTLMCASQHDERCPEQTCFAKKAALPCLSFCTFNLRYFYLHSPSSPALYLWLPHPFHVLWVSFANPPPFTPRLWGKPIYHRPKEGLHFVCFRDFPSISCSPNERGCRVPASPRRLKGAKSPVPSPVRGSNYPSRGPLRGALPSKQSNSHSGLSHIGPWPGHHHKKGPWTSMSYDPDRSWWFSGPWPG